MTEDEKLALYYVTEFCKQMEEATGMPALEVYDTMFDGKDYTVNVKQSGGELEVQITFDEGEDQ